MLDHFFNKIWYENRFKLVIIFLYPLSLIYMLVMSFRNFIYEITGRAKKLNSFVISIGNINLGGTGKTPFLLYLLSLLHDKKILVLTRGYGGRLEGDVADRAGFSDEARLLKKRFPHIAIFAGKNRYKSYKIYKKKYGKPELIILDDGFQHRAIKRDLDILMISGSLMFGNGLVFPAGPLREAKSSLKRADLIILKDGDDGLIRDLKKQYGDRPIFSFQKKEVYLADTKDMKVNIDFSGKKILAFCSIANPLDFKRSIEKLGIELAYFLSFNDHYNYSETDIKKIKSAGAEIFLTTEKDWAKIKDFWLDKENIYVLKLEYELREKDELLRLIKERGAMNA